MGVGATKWVWSTIVPILILEKLAPMQVTCQEVQVLVIATARNKQELNRKPLTSQGTHTFDRVHWSVENTSFLG